MTLATPVALTGANGRLGRALMDELGRRGLAAIPWTRPEYDLDEPATGNRLVARDAPGMVIHSAAWTDVDACATEPDLAHRRNAEAVRELAEACVVSGAALVFISTNEVFDGERTDGSGYSEDDPVGPINAYGQSKLAGEEGAREAFARAGAADRLWIVRTSWLYGPPGNDFPAKIVAAADRLAPGDALRVVTDEIGSPTYAPDLASALLDLVAAAPSGTYHLAGAAQASRFELATAAIERCRPGTPLEPITRAEYRRVSEPPAWSVLDCSKAAAFGVAIRPWREGLSDYLSGLC